MLELEEFKANTTAQLAAERAFQAATECCCDIGNHLIAVAGLQQPDEQRKVFPTLAESGYFDQDYANRMSQMVALRNRLVHLYWDIDMELLYRYMYDDVPLFERFEVFVLQLLEMEA